MAVNCTRKDDVKIKKPDLDGRAFEIMRGRLAARHVHQRATVRAGAIGVPAVHALVALILRTAVVRRVFRAAVEDALTAVRTMTGKTATVVSSVAAMGVGHAVGSARPAAGAVIAVNRII